MNSSSLPSAASVRSAADVLVEDLARFEELPQRLAEIIEGVVEFLKSRVGIAEPGIEQVLGEGLEQVFHVHLGGQVADVFCVANALHDSS